MASTKVAQSKRLLSPKELLRGIFAFAPNPDSFGGISYLIRGESRNFMVDVPEDIEENILFVEQSGSPEFIFLTHRDDVADAEMFRERFGSKLIIHESERYAVRNPEIIFRDFHDIEESAIIHTPVICRALCKPVLSERTSDFYWRPYHCRPREARGGRLLVDVRLQTPDQKCAQTSGS